MDRYTRKDAERAFERLCEGLGQRIATGYGDVDGWVLDYNSVYGGFVVESVSNANGGVHQPFGSTRHPAREFCAMVNFALRAVELVK